MAVEPLHQGYSRKFFREHNLDNRSCDHSQISQGGKKPSEINTAPPFFLHLFGAS